MFFGKSMTFSKKKKYPNFLQGDKAMKLLMKFKETGLMLQQNQLYLKNNVKWSIFINVKVESTAKYLERDIKSKSVEGLKGMIKKISRPTNLVKCNSIDKRMQTQKK